MPKRPMSEVMTLSLDSIDQFRDWLSDRGRSPYTVKSYSSDLRMLLLAAGTSSVPIGEYEQAGLTWLRATRQEAQPRTTQRRLTSLRAFASWAGHPGMFDDFIAPTPAKSNPKPLPEGWPGVDRMIAKARTDSIGVVVALQGYGGLRIGEALNMPIDHFDFGAAEMKIRGKGDHTRIVPMSDELMEVVLPFAIQRGRGNIVDVEDRLARRSITRLGKYAGISVQVSTHMLRATFATETLAICKDIRTVQELMGHAQVTTTEVYTQVTMKAMRDAITRR